MTGLEFAQHVLRLKPDMKLILMTAYQVESVELEMGVPIIRHEDILKKPFMIKEICDSLRNILQIRN